MFVSPFGVASGLAFSSGSTGFAFLLRWGGFSVVFSGFLEPIDFGNRVGTLVSETSDFRFRLELIASIDCRCRDHRVGSLRNAILGDRLTTAKFGSAMIRGRKIVVPG